MRRRTVRHCRRVVIRWRLAFAACDWPFAAFMVFHFEHSLARFHIVRQRHFFTSGCPTMDIALPVDIHEPENEQPAPPGVDPDEHRRGEKRRIARDHAERYLKVARGARCPSRAPPAGAHGCAPCDTAMPANLQLSPADKNSVLDAHVAYDVAREAHRRELPAAEQPAGAPVTVAHFNTRMDQLAGRMDELAGRMDELAAKQRNQRCRRINRLRSAGGLREALKWPVKECAGYLAAYDWPAPAPAAIRNAPNADAVGSALPPALQPQAVTTATIKQLLRVQKWYNDDLDIREGGDVAVARTAMLDFLCEE